MLLENKIALITGASRGIGRDTAITLAGEGALTILLGRHKDTLQKVKEEIESAGGKAAIAVCDLSDEKQIKETSEKLLKDYGCIDILVNNAGITIEGSFLELPTESFDTQMLVNVRAPMLLMHAFIPAMLKKGEGAIVNIAAGVGVRGCPGASAYATSKAALINLTLSVGEEVRRQGVRLNCICPGPVDTDMFRNSTLHDYEMKRGGDVTKPGTIANAVLFLASDMTKSLTCQNVIVRGASRW